MKQKNVTTAKATIMTPTKVGSVSVALMFLLLVLYMYFLSMSVVDVVFRKESHKMAAALESEISTLEAKYIEAQHKVSERIASAQILSETSEKIFVERTQSKFVLSSN